jgi:hypothetical protein
MGRIEWFRKYRYTIPEPVLCEDQDLLTRSYKNSQFATLTEIQFAYRTRRKKPLKKSLKTRFSVFRMQAQNFLKMGDIHHALLAVGVLLVRLVHDLLNQLLPAGRQAGHHRAQLLDNTELEKWQSVRKIYMSDEARTQ